MLRLCVIGTGRAGLVHAANIKHHIKQAELAALCDSNPEELARVGRELSVERQYPDYREALRDPEVEAVVIATPAFLHREIACEAAARGKHVFLEKPMALSVAECNAINDAVAQARVTLQIGFMRRFDAAFLEAKQLLDSGEIGRVMIIKSTGRGPGLPPQWIYDVRKSNGILAEVNSHDFDSVRWLVGSDIVRVHAEAANFKCEDVRKSHPDFYDNAVVSLRFADRTLGMIDGTCPAHYGYDARVEILCEKGVLFIGSVEDRGVMQATHEGRVITRAVESWRNLFREAYLAEMQHFIECVRQGATPRATGLDGLKAVEAVVAANLSIQRGEPVKVGVVDTTRTPTEGAS
jgi:myo-inositol 2-dehydrogenase/D-chiro-inositol 1-dehydrogenase/scyllo-inositol 2-dehydrogenase (NAD+)